MRLASFFGLTAPMLILADFAENQIVNYVQLLNTTADRELLEFSSIELEYLYRAINNIPYDYENNEDVINTEKKLIINVAHKLIRRKESVKLDKMGCVDDIRNEILAQVRSYMSGGKFDSSRLSAASVAIANTMIDKSIVNNENKIEEFVKNIELAFNLKRIYNTNIPGRDGLVVFSSDEFNVVDFFIKRIETIKKYKEIFNVQRKNGGIFFDIPLTELLRSSDMRLKMIVANRLQALKNETSKHKFCNVINSTREDIINFEKELNKVVPDSDKSRFVGLSKEEFDEIQIKNEDCTELFSFLQKENKVSSLDTNTLETLICVYKRLISLDCAALNNKMDIDFEEGQYDDLIHKLNCIGICGINLYSKDLFLDMLKSSVLYQYDQLILEDECLQRLFKNLEEIKALFDSILPIGYELTGGDI